MLCIPSWSHQAHWVEHADGNRNGNSAGTEQKVGTNFPLLYYLKI